MRRPRSVILSGRLDRFVPFSATTCHRFFTMRVRKPKCRAVGAARHFG
jgi:hypothetical protein